MEKRKGESGVTIRLGMSRVFKIVTIKSSIPKALAVGVKLRWLTSWPFFSSSFDSSSVYGYLGAAATGMMGV